MMETYEMPELLTKTDVASLLGVSFPTAMIVVNQEGFPSPVMIGRRPRWRREAVKAWVDAQ